MSSDRSNNTNTIFIDYKDLPKFLSKVPASNALLRNQEVEHFLRQLELNVHPTNDGQLIRKARVEG